MSTSDIQGRCDAKAKELLDKYFGNIVNEAVYQKPEVLDERYPMELPFQIEAEYLQFLGELKAELLPEDTRSIGQLIDRPLKREMIKEDYGPDVQEAYDEAKAITFWEKVTGSNHDDVAYFKGLIKQYTEELLDHMTNDFLNLGETL